MLKMKSLLSAALVIGSLVFSASSFSATDPMNGYDAQKAKEYFASKMAYSTGPVEVSKMIQKKDKKIQIIDVRLAEDFAKGHVPGAISMPPDSWDNAQAKLDKNKIAIIYCYTQACHLAAEAAAKFAAEGYHVMEMDGGYKAWVDNKFKVEHS